MRLSNALAISVFFCSVTASISCSQSGVASGAGQEVQACKFVQSFLDWYVPNSRAAKGAADWIAMLKSRQTSFQSPLWQALREDSEAQAKSKGEIVGVDFDPFLNSQDPATSYVAGSVRRLGKEFRVEIVPKGHSSPPESARVSAEVVKTNGGWQFSNFYYPEKWNLRSVLAALKKERGGRE